MSDGSDILFQLVVKKEGDKYTASTLSGGYTVTSSSPIDAVMNWGFRVREGIKRYRNGEITFEYFASRLGVSEAEARLILDSQEIIELTDERLKLDRLFQDLTFPVKSQKAYSARILAQVQQIRYSN